MSAEPKPITFVDAAYHRQDGEGLRDAYFRLLDERREFQSEGSCGTFCCSCQVPCGITTSQPSQPCSVLECSA